MRTYRKIIYSGQPKSYKDDGWFFCGKKLNQSHPEFNSGS